MKVEREIIKKKEGSVTPKRRKSNPSSSSDYKDKKREIKAGRPRGRPPVEPVKVKDIKGVECEVVYEDGKAVGKKQPDGKFIPYKARGRKPIVQPTAKNLGGSKASAPKPDRKSGEMSIEDLLAEETIKQEKQAA